MQARRRITDPRLPALRAETDPSFPVVAPTQGEAAPRPLTPPAAGPLARRALKLVRFEHTLFSLPMLFGGAWLGGRAAESAPPYLAIVAAGVGARTFAMAINRIVDRAIDARNPRTADRELPRGTTSIYEAMAIAGGGALLFAVALAFLPVLCTLLAPVPLALFLIYPHTKRVTAACHLVLGLCLGLAPLGAWVATTGALPALTDPVVTLSLFTTAWVAGFDIIYALADLDFDRTEGLHSVPAWLGRRGALVVSSTLHLVAFGLLVGMTASMGGFDAARGSLLAAIAILLALEVAFWHRPLFAFFGANVWVGVLVLGLIATGGLP